MKTELTQEEAFNNYSTKLRCKVPLSSGVLALGSISRARSISAARSIRNNELLLVDDRRPTTFLSLFRVSLSVYTCLIFLDVLVQRMLQTSLRNGMNQDSKVVLASDSSPEFDYVGMIAFLQTVKLEFEFWNRTSATVRPPQGSFGSRYNLAAQIPSAAK